MDHAARFLADAETNCQLMPRDAIECLAEGLSKLRDRGGRMFLLGVGGGDANRDVGNLVKAIDLAKKHSAKVFGIVGKDTGCTAKLGDAVVVIPQVNPAWVTPLSEAFQAVVWHCLVSRPKLQKRLTKW